MRKLVAVDVDGVLAHMTKRLLQYLREATDIDRTEAAITEYEIEKALGLDDHASHLMWKAMGEEGVCAAIEPYPGAQAFITTLREQCDVVALTSPLGSSTWERERKQWLYDHMGIKGKDVIYCSSQHKHRYAADALIEDRYDTLRDWFRFHRPCGVAILVARPWNQNEQLPEPLRQLRHWYRCHDYLDILSSLQAAGIIP